MKIKFPNKEELVDLLEGEPIVILGANGAGKTRFSAQLEELNDPSFRNGRNTDSEFLIHRISAQKSQSISKDLSIKGVSISEREVFIGNSSEHASKNVHRYGNNPSTYLIDDYNKVLALLFSKNNEQLEKQRDKEKEEIAQNKKRSLLENCDYQGKLTD